MKKFLLKIFDLTGIYISRSFKYKGKTTFSIGHLSYTKILPTANYAPWLADTAFMEIFGPAKQNSMVDIYRAYELWQLTEQQILKFPHGSILEVGVWRGGTGLVMAKRISQSKAQNKIYLADTFSGVVKTSDKDEFYTGNEHNETSKALVQNLFNQYAADARLTLLEGIFPDETAHLIPNEEKICLCHIDVDVYESARDIVQWVLPKLLPGGIIVFDDYGFHFCTGISELVNEYRKDSDKLIIHNLNGHAIMVKTA